MLRTIYLGTWYIGTLVPGYTIHCFFFRSAASILILTPK